MPVEIFTKADFEVALPTKNGAPLWECLGLRDGEYSYLIPCTNEHGVGIHIRSSVGSNGLSAECGEDSIRAWIVDAVASRKGDDRPLGSKISRWTTRLPGWQRRIWNPTAEKAKDKGILYILGGMARQIAPCPKCGTRTKVFRVKKDGPNKGRAFLRCPSTEEGSRTSACDYFEWLDDREGDSAPPAPAAKPKPPEVVRSCRVTFIVSEDKIPEKVFDEILAFLIDRGVEPKLETMPALPRTVTIKEEEGDEEGLETLRASIDSRGTRIKPNIEDRQPCKVEVQSKCPVCGGKTRALTVKKEGPNHGRPFVNCTGEGCKYFNWLDEGATEEP